MEKDEWIKKFRQINNRFPTSDEIVLAKNNKEIEFNNKHIQEGTFNNEISHEINYPQKSVFDWIKYYKDLNNKLPDAKELSKALSNNEFIITQKKDERILNRQSFSMKDVQIKHFKIEGNNSNHQNETTNYKFLLVIFLAVFSIFIGMILRKFHF